MTDCLPQIQTSTWTSARRYPNTFAVLRSLMSPSVARKKSISILSFGCSSGAETLELSEIFPTSRILGLDVSLDALEQAKRNASMPNITYKLSSAQALFEEGPFDLICAMSVLCRWPETRKLQNIGHLYSFDQFNETIALFDNCLNVGGVLVIHNSNFNFLDTEVSRKYSICLDPTILTSGEVTKFSRNDQKIECYTPDAWEPASNNLLCTDSIYRKDTDCAPLDRGRLFQVIDRNASVIGRIGISAPF
jgi:hypothetical protein